MSVMSVGSIDGNSISMNVEKMGEEEVVTESTDMF